MRGRAFSSEGRGPCGLDRRSFVLAGAAALAASRAGAQGYGGLGESGEGYAPVVPGRMFAFPADHGPHPDFRIEWWYLTANLTDDTGAPCGLQWTLFRQAARPGAQGEGWDDPQVWMAHAAVTRADTHRFAETFARGGVGQAGAEASPFHAFIDAWELRQAASDIDPMRIVPLDVRASGKDFSYRLRLGADRPLVLQGDNGFSRKSERGQASYYYSQPFFAAEGALTIDGVARTVKGLAWMDREWSSQPLAADQKGWDWFSLHFDDGNKLMLFRLRDATGGAFVAGTFIGRDGATSQLSPGDVVMTPGASSDVAGRRLPTQWTLEMASRGLRISCAALNPQSWMGTGFAYWEGPIRISGSHPGVGYLEMTGY